MAQNITVIASSRSYPGTMGLGGFALLCGERRRK
jgi:hypothetical protein